MNLQHEKQLNKLVETIKSNQEFVNRYRDKLKVEKNLPDTKTDEFLSDGGTPAKTDEFI